MLSYLDLLEKDKEYYFSDQIDIINYVSDNAEILQK